MSAGDMLLRAAQLIEERGWTTGESEDDAGQVCAVGAIWRAATGIRYPRLVAPTVVVERGEVTVEQHNEYRRAMATMQEWLKAQTPEVTPRTAVVLWNDAAAGPDEVVAGLRAAAHA